MTQEKMRKVITAGAVAATLLLVFLLSYLVYQWIASAVYDKRINQMEQEISRLEEEFAENTKSAEWLEKDWVKELLAQQYGYVFPED